jgi:hypothetical protein
MGKTKEMIHTLIEMWNNPQILNNSENRKQRLKRFVNYYNTVKLPKVILSKTPYKFLEDYFSHEA